MSAKGAYPLAVFAAVGLHLTGFALWGEAETGGAEAAGANGADLVTLAASSAALAQLVTAWERPPEVAEDPLTPHLPLLENSPEPIILASEPPPNVSSRAPLPMPAPPKVRPKVSSPPKPQPPEPKPADTPNPVEKPKMKKAPAKPSVATPQQVAKGQGGAQSSGTQGAAQAGTATAQAKALWAEWGAQIRHRIERKKRYPTGAGGAQGKVTVQLRVATSGALQSVSVARSSGSAALDRAAVQAVKAAGKFPAAPTALSEPAYSFNLSISFTR